MNKLRFFAPLFVVFSFVFPLKLFALDSDIPSEAGYFLSSVQWHIKGRTLPQVLSKKVDIVLGERWNSLEDVYKWVQEKEQLMLNERILDSANITITIGEGTADTPALPIELSIEVRDTWNIIALPKPKYSSADGLDLSLRFRDYNFLGLMEGLRVNLGYSLDSQAFEEMAFTKGAWYSEFEFKIPFDILKKEAEIENSLFLGWTEDQVFQFSNASTFNIFLPYGPGYFTYGVSQKFILNEINEGYYQETYGKYLENWYFQSGTSLSYTFNIGGLRFFNTAVENINSFSVNTSYLPDLSDIGEERQGLVINFSERIQAGRIDWKKNYRTGNSFYLQASLPFNFYTRQWNPSIEGSFISHNIINSFIGFSARTVGFHNFIEVDSRSGDYIRGVVWLWATSAFIANIDLDFKLFSFRPHIWFDKKWMRFFAFEFHTTLFTDIALADYRKTECERSFRNWYITAGSEILIYPEFSRSLFFRASLGFDTLDFPKTKEIFIGLGHHY